MHCSTTYHVDFWDGVNAGDIYAHSHNDRGTWKKSEKSQKSNAVLSVAAVSCNDFNTRSGSSYSKPGPSDDGSSFRSTLLAHGEQKDSRKPFWELLVLIDTASPILISASAMRNLCFFILPLPFFLWNLHLNYTSNLIFIHLFADQGIFRQFQFHNITPTAIAESVQYVN